MKMRTVFHALVLYNEICRINAQNYPTITNSQNH